MTEFEKLVLEIETKGLDEANSGLARLDAQAKAATASFARLDMAAHRASATVAGFAATMATATGSISASVTASGASTAVMEANTAALVGLTAATNALSSTILANTSTTAANTATTTANTTANNAAAAAASANTAATTANTTATAAASGVHASSAAATTANTAAVSGNTAAQATNAGALATNTAAITSGTAATTARTASTVTYTAATRTATVATGGFATALWGLAAPLAAIVTPLVVIKELIRGTRTFEDFSAQLRTSTGTAEKAAVAYEALMDFAIETPYSLSQAVGAFTKLTNFGLDPSERALRSYGNTASAMGKELDQMIQAVAMATVNNFIRLKQFGILAHKEGEQIIFDFQGVRTRVQADARSVEAYLMRLGEVEFADAMKRRMTTLTGAMSNFGDEWLKFTQNVSKEGVGQAITNVFQGGIEALSELNAQLASGEFDARMQAYGMLWKNTFRDIEEGVGVIVDFMKDVFTVFGFYSQDARGEFDVFIKYFPEQVRANMQIAAAYTITFFEKFKVSWGLIGDIYAIGWDAMTDYGATAVTTISNVFTALVDSGKASAKLLIEAFRIEFDRLIGYARATGAAIAAALGGTMPDITAELKKVDDQASQSYLNLSNTATKAAANFKKAVDEVNGVGTAFDKVGQDADKRLIDKATEAAAVVDDLERTRDGVISGVVTDLDKITAAYDKQMAKADELRAKHDASQTVRRASGDDRLAEFRHEGDGSSAASTANDKKAAQAAAKALRQEEQLQKQILEVKLRNLEEGLVDENAVLSASYEEQRTAILKNATTTAEEKQQLILMALSTGIVTEEQSIWDSYERRREFILSSTELTETAKNELIKRLEEKRAKDSLASTIRLHQKELDVASTFFGNLESIGRAFGEKGFKMAKAAAIAQATIKMYESAVSAYAAAASIPYVGIYLAPVAAAAAVAAGAANIASIKSQQYSGAYEYGGMIPSGKVGLVGEAGPELIRGPAVVTSANTTAARGVGGIRNITINNNGAPVQAQAQMNGDELMIMLKPHLEATREQTKREIASGLRQGGTPIAKSLEQGYGITRSNGIGMPV